jgi:HD-GYP domain-containing protein (c-di-GMP phosphodiesterase class II)
MATRVTLVRDLVDCRGLTLARRGAVLDPEAVGEAAARARPEPARPLSGSVVVEDLRLAFAEPVYRHLFRQAEIQPVLARVLLSAELPECLHQELRLLRDDDPARYRHGLATALVAGRMLLAAVGDAKALPDLAAAALLHDLGMRHVVQDPGSAPLSPAEVLEVAGHPLLGAYHLACVLGPHPAVDAALGHHWRRGTGYPRLTSPPHRSVEVIAVASAFAALTQPRSFRSTPFDARGATDVLVGDAEAGEADLESVQLLVHVLRGAQGEVRRVRFGRERVSQGPEDNRYTPIARVMASA